MFAMSQKQSFKCITLKSQRKQASLAGMNEEGLDATEAESDIGMAIGVCGLLSTYLT